MSFPSKLSGLEFQAHPISVDLQSETKAMLNFNVFANPTPEGNKFSVTRIGPSDKGTPVQIFVVFVKKVSLPYYKENAFEVIIVCHLPRSGEFSVKYENNFVRSEKTFSFVQKGELRNPCRSQGR